VDCCSRRGIFLLIDPPSSANSVQTMQQFAATLPRSRDAAVYFPRVIIRDPVNDRPRSTAPSGTVAGMIARCDAKRGVWRAPAGSEATLAGVDALESNLADSDVNALAAAGVNCLREFPGRPLMVWSARTLASLVRNEPEWKYVPIRRLLIFIEDSLCKGTQWAVFEPNDEPLWNHLRKSIETFLLTLWREQAFVGMKSQEAFFVRCGRDQTMTANDIANGVLNIEVGFAPVRPAEFVIVRIQHQMNTTPT
jgi:phage tail sheath protein FI